MKSRNLSMKTLLNTYKLIENILTAEGIEQNEAKIEAKMLLKHFLNVSDNDFILDKDLQDTTIVEAKAFQRAQTKAPIQHIIGHAYFMGEDFIVNKHTLIPRDETEFLVRKSVEIIAKNNFKQVLDIGTGSGCIACMIGKLSPAQVIGVDISTDALQIALDNATKLDLNNKAIFRKSDVFSNVKKDEKFDLIVSNPPYIPPSEKINIQEEVTFDPELALYTTDEKGVEFYEKITNEAPRFLTDGGYLIFELGIGQAKHVQEFMESQGFSDIEIIKDLAGIERVISGKLVNQA